MTVKTFLLLAMCIVGTFAQLDPLVVQCAKELKIDLGDLDTETIFSDRATENERHCILACTFRKTDKKAKSLYEALMHSVDGVTNKPLLRIKVMEKLEKCKETDGDDDCKMMKCIDIFKSPFLDYFVL